MVKTGFNWTRECPRFLADVTGHGRCDIVGFGTDGVWVAKSDGAGGFLQAERMCDGFAYNKGSWRVGQHVRAVGQLWRRELVAEDVVAAGATTGAHSVHQPGVSERLSLGTTGLSPFAVSDLVGFGDDGVWTAYSGGDRPPPWPVQFALRNFGVNQSWQVNRDVRVLADLTGNGVDSIVGFGEEGVWIALNNDGGGFDPNLQFFPGFGFTQGWRLNDHPRLAADLNGTGRADLVGFGENAVQVAFNDGSGHFTSPAQGVLNDLCVNQGWGAEHPRFVARLTKNRRADLLGFKDDDVWVARNNGDNTFGARSPNLLLPPNVHVAQPTGIRILCYNQGWRVERHPRFVVDLTGSGQADLLGFGDDDIWIALNDGNGNFKLARPANVNNLCFNQGWRVDLHPRFLADVTGNGLPDIVGFGDDGVWVALNNGDGTFGQAKFVLNDFGYQSGTAGIDHVFVLIMENRSFDHMLGFSGITGTDAVTGEPTTIDGLTGSECNTLDGSACGSTGAEQFMVQKGAHDIMPKDPGHSFRSTLTQLMGPGNDAWTPGQAYPTTLSNSGFVAQYGPGGPITGPGEIMRCFGTDQPQPTDDPFIGHVPVLHALANEFVVCDRWFSSLPGPTFPNRMFAHAASSGSLDDQPGSSDIAAWELSGGQGFVFQHGTIFKALDRAKLGYRVYGTREPPFSVDAERPFPMAACLDGISIDSVRDLGVWPYPGNNPLVDDLAKEDFAAVRYVHIEPSYGFLDKFKYGTSQHPLGSVRAGDNFIKTIYEAIRNSPVWESSLLIITWDEHGGFFDHVPPPAAIPPGDRATAQNQNGFLFDRLGVRVPAIIISPRIPKNLIDHRAYDHASIPATIERLFGLDPLTDRDRAATSMLLSADETTPPCLATSLLTLMAPRTDCPTIVGPRSGIEPTPRTTATTPPYPAASINEADAVPLLAVLVAQDLQVSGPEERAAIFRRVREIKTHADAWAYMKEVEQKIAARRLAPV